MSSHGISKIDQKKYLKKYLSGDKVKKKKKDKKNKKHSTSRHKNVRIIDDNAFDNKAAQEIDEELLLAGDDAPQIVGEYIEEYPNRVPQNKWRSIMEEKTNDEVTIKQEPIDDYGAGDANILWGFQISNVHVKIEDEISPKLPSLSRIKYRDQYSLSPPQIKEEDKAEKSIDGRKKYLSPSRRKQRKQSIDQSPPRKKQYELSKDLSPPRRKRDKSPSLFSRQRQSVMDQTPLTKYKTSKSKHKRAISADHLHKRPESLQSSNKNKEEEQIKHERRSSSDQSPLRRNSSHRDSIKHSSTHSLNNSQTKRKPPTRLNAIRLSTSKLTSNCSRSSSRDLSPKRQIHLDRSPSFSPSPQHRKNRWKKIDPSSLSPPPTHKHKSNKTLDGKQAGLQNASALKMETEARRRNEERMYEKMSGELSGRDAEVQVRSTGRRGKHERNAQEEDPEEQRRKEALEKKKKESYDRWGLGLKQVEDYRVRLAEEEYEAKKPLSRYANDEDLDRHLREQERAEDPMLEYMRRKKKEKQIGTNESAIPVYEGPYPENRFGIRPGYRWDGVDRSNGYERKWFSVQNEKRAMQDEAYKYSVEDM